jgi:hypothetical protein
MKGLLKQPVVKSIFRSAFGLSLISVLISNSSSAIEIKAGRTR